MESALKRRPAKPGRCAFVSSLKFSEQVGPGLFRVFPPAMGFGVTHGFSFLKSARRTLLAAIFLGVPAAAQTFLDEGLWDVGAQVQGFVDGEPGNDYLTGVDVGYSNYDLYEHQLELRFAYLTSRPEAYIQSHKFSGSFPYWTSKGDPDFGGVVRQDWFLLSPTWHFRRRDFFDPTVELDAAFQRYDTEFQDLAPLQNTTFVFGARVGLCLNFAAGRYTLHYTFGYQVPTSSSSIVYPLPFSLGLTMLLY